MSSVKTDKRKNSKSDSALLSHTIDIFTFFDFMFVSTFCYGSIL